MHGKVKVQLETTLSYLEPTGGTLYINVSVAYCHAMWMLHERICR